MDTNLTGQETMIVDGFRALLDSVDRRASAGRHMPIHDLHTELNEAGWLDLGFGDPGPAQPFWVLVALAEACGARRQPLAYPLIETWTGLRMLTAAGVRVDMSVGPISCGVEPMCAATPGHSGPIPFAREVDTVVVPVLRPSGRFGLVATCPRGLELRSDAQLDPMMSSGSFELSQIGDGVAGEITRSQADVLVAGYLTLQAAEIVGSANELFNRTLRHLSQREQFGRQLSGFQALQHRAADLLVSLETSRSVTHYAGWACEVHPELALRYARLAKGMAAEAGWKIATDAVQLHGAVGFTWETGLQFAAARVIFRALTGATSAECFAQAGLDSLSDGSILGLIEEAHSCSNLSAT